ncbi:MAG: phenylalanine--tRNA ligase subunit alpha [Armatimonadetes bacterium]|nr:phenylalanine--tRNA ligase subunit alpha [Armatimonadota bacterium]
MLIEEINLIKEDAQGLINQSGTLKELEEIKIKFLGKKAKLSQILKSLGSVSKEERIIIGLHANRVKNVLEENIKNKTEILKQKQEEKSFQEEVLDLTFPGKRFSIGHFHPLTLVAQEIIEIFIGLGFEVVDGPEIESDYYNFEALNIGKDHPARDMWDSFYLEEKTLLRTHTSPVQIRVMRERQPPLRVVSYGKCYRRDAVDATHSWMFHQLEGFMADKEVSFADLKGILTAFAAAFFGKERKTKFIPAYFPFTEPSAEMSIDCFLCIGKGCKACHYSGWLEILGSGMIHPQVFRNVNYDSEKYSGFAFGMGIERIAMLKYGINDIRLFFENDLRFLRQF